MPRINVNLNDVTDSQFELFTEGLHSVEIQPSTKLKQSETGGPYIQIIAKCFEGEMKDKMIGWICSLLPSALWNLKGLLEVIGLEWDEDGFDLEDLFERQVVINVSHREYPIGSKEMRNEVEAGYFAVESAA